MAYYNKVLLLDLWAIYHSIDFIILREVWTKKGRKREEGKHIKIRRLTAVCEREFCKCVSFKVKLDKGQTDCWGNDVAMVMRKWVNWPDRFFPYAIAMTLSFISFKCIYRQMDCDLSIYTIQGNITIWAMGLPKITMLNSTHGKFFLLRR